MKAKSCVTMTILLLAASPALAHDLWLQPRTALAVDGKPTIFDLTIGTAYPDLEAVVKATRVTSSGWRTAGANGGFDNRSEESSSLALEASPTGGGDGIGQLPEVLEGPSTRGMASVGCMSSGSSMREVASVRGVCPTGGRPGADTAR